MSLIYPAATVVLLRERASAPEVLMLKRSQQVSLAKGLWVFPGGRIDQEDYRQDLEDVFTAAHYAAVREAQEETQLRISAEQLQYFAHWTTPAGAPKRFATWFFLATVAPTTRHSDVTVDGGEILESRWCQPAEALADYRSGCLDMLPPTLATLTLLSGAASVDEAMQTAKQQAQSRTMPAIQKTAEGLWVTNPEQASLPKQGIQQYALEEPWR